MLATLLMLATRRTLVALPMLLLLLAAPAFGSDPVVLDLWPGKAPGESADIGPEKSEPSNDTIERLTNVSKPTIAVYKPPRDKDTGVAVIVAPGGGYNILAIGHEGKEVADWLNSIGVTGVVLKYRVPRRPDQPKDQPPVGALQDAQRAISLVRAHADEWGVDPKRVGLLGFSAGGHLTAWAATNFDRRAYSPVDDADKLSARPDFAVMIYPGGVIRRDDPTKLSPEIRVSAETPPCFLAHAFDDPVSPENSIALFVALKAAKVPTDLHIYAKGGHGFGLRADRGVCSTWPARCEDWMRSIGWIK